MTAPSSSNASRGWWRGLLSVPLVAVVLLAPLAPGAHAAPHAAQQRPRPAPSANGRYIVLYRSGVDPTVTTADISRRHGVRARNTFRSAVHGVAATLDATQVNDLRADPAVALVAPDLPVHATAEVPVANGDTVPTGVRRIGAGTSTTARQASTATVAVVDTGVDLTNPDLNVTAGPNCVNPGTPPADDNGHGTHVAGTIGAKNNGTGVVGVAPGTHLDAVKVLDASGSGSYSNIICGLDWVTGTRTDSDPANDVSVVNLSLGGTGESLTPCATTTDALHQAICSATAHGITVVVAAGNSSYDYDYAPQPDTPAAYPEVLTVTAVSDSDGLAGGTGGAPGCFGGSDDVAATFSNYATSSAAFAHTIAGPGVCITSDAPGGGTAVMSGTSMATPHLAGEVALCLGEGGAAGPCAGLSPAQIITRMRSDAATYNAANPGYGFAGDPAHPVTGEYFGYLAHAVAAPGATLATTPPTVTVVSPTPGKTAVPLPSPVTVTFDQPMDQTATQAAFSLKRSSTNTAVGGSFSWSGNTMTFRPFAAYVPGAVYQATVGTAAQGSNGASLTSGTAWSFRAVYAATAKPTAVQAWMGTYRSGSVSSLGTDDNVYYVVAGAANNAAMIGTFPGVDNDIASLTISYQGKNSMNPTTQYVQLFNWRLNRWDTLDTRSIGTSEVLVSKTVGGTLADYVSNTTGPGDIRLQARDTRGGAFTMYGERMGISYTR